MARGIRAIDDYTCVFMELSLKDAFTACLKNMLLIFNIPFDCMESLMYLLDPLCLFTIF